MPCKWLNPAGNKDKASTSRVMYWGKSMQPLIFSTGILLWESAHKVLLEAFLAHTWAIYAYRIILWCLLVSVHSGVMRYNCVACLLPTSINCCHCNCSQCLIRLCSMFLLPKQYCFTATGKRNCHLAEISAIPNWRFCCNYCYSMHWRAVPAESLCKRSRARSRGLFTVCG